MTAVLQRTEDLVNEAYQNRREPIEPQDDEVLHKGHTLLTFPSLYQPSSSSKSENPRISEQELRFAFVQSFSEYVKENGLSYYYAVEAPTKSCYIFKVITTKEDAIDNDKENKKQKNSRSGRFDMVIYNEHAERVCLIEFKEGNPDAKEFAKDFIKLGNPKEGVEDSLRYFIHLHKNDDTKEEIEKTVRNKVKKEFPKVTISNEIKYKVVFLKRLADRTS